MRTSHFVAQFCCGSAEVSNHKIWASSFTEKFLQFFGNLKLKSGTLKVPPIQIKIKVLLFLTRDLSLFCKNQQNQHVRKSLKKLFLSVKFPKSCEIVVKENCSKMKVLMLTNIILHEKRIILNSFMLFLLFWPDQSAVT